MDTPLRILGLQVENIKRVKAVSITPGPNSVTISGKNDQGKTSILDAIEYALGGKQGICEQPIRAGQQKARIVCDLGDITVTRTFSAVSGESSLTVKGKDGAPVKSPQSLLDSLCHHVAFDPLSFVRLKPMEQVDTLQKLVGLDFSALNDRRQKLYEERTLVGRELERAKAQIQEFPFYAEAPEKEQDATELVAKLTAAQQSNKDAAAFKRRIDERKNEGLILANAKVMSERRLVELERQMAETKAQLVKIAEQQAMLSADVAALEKQAAAFVPQDEEPIKSSLFDVQTINRKVQANTRHVAHNKAIQEKQFAYDALTHQIEGIDQDKLDQITFANFPLPGLSVSDSSVLLNGVPFSQGSQARQLQAAVAIGLALNPKVRVILIRDASLLDDDSMKLMQQVAIERDAQIWFEVVNSKDPAAVVIEDGTIKQ